VKLVSKIIVIVLFVSPIFLVNGVGTGDYTTQVTDAVDIPISAEASWLSGWSFRKSHVINGSTCAGTDYQISINVHFGSGTDNGTDVYCESLVNTDFSDIRFTDDDGITELSHWMESNHESDNATFWVRILDDLDFNQSIFVYFGNLGAVSAIDGTSTFIAWDDFDLGYEVGDSPKSSRGWFITDNGTGDILEIAANPTGKSGNGMRYVNVETAAPGMMLENTWTQELSISIHMKLYWDIRDGQFRFNSYDIDDEDSSVATWSNYVSGYYLRYRDSPSTNLQYSPAYELLEDVWYDIESQCEYNAHSLIVNNTTLSGTVRTTGDGYDHIWIYGHEDQLDDFYVDDFFVRKFVSDEPTHGIWGELESEPADGVDWLSDWEFRKSHSIEGSLGAEYNYQVKIVVHNGTGVDSADEVYCNGYCLPNFGDIRFTDNDGITELDYWMEESHVSDNATFWVEILDTLDYDQVIYVYFGNPDAVSVSDGVSTFIFFDDFEDDSIGADPDSNRWWLEATQDSTDYVRIAQDPEDSSNQVAEAAESGDSVANVAWANDWGSAGSIAIGHKFRYDLDYKGYYTTKDASNTFVFIEQLEYLGTNNHQWYDADLDYFDYSPSLVTITDEWYSWEYRFSQDSMILLDRDNDALSTGGFVFSTVNESRTTCTRYGLRHGANTWWTDDVYVRTFTPSEPTHNIWGDIESALSIDSPADVTYEVGTTGHSFEWSIFSYYPDRNLIFLDDVLQTNITWDGTQIEISVDGLNPGNYNYTLEIINTFGYSKSNIVFVNVEDTTNPVLTHPVDLNYSVGSQGNTIQWNMTDLYPDTYEIYLENELLRSGSWNSTGETVSVSVDGFPVGEYNLTLTASDESGNTMSDSVTVTVTTTGQIDTIVIIIMIGGVAVVLIVGAIVCRRRP